jgi:UDP-MurNAc hydroxylase
MEFQVLSHAGLLVRSRQTTLVCDPWLVGSVYWRSWWNYPPVSKDLVETLRPDFIYLTHIHWDHFQGVSLRKFHFATPVVVPKSPSDRRLVQDLAEIGFHNVIEVAHGESVDLDPELTITSYHFGPCPDSVLVASCEGVTLVNANDAKIMGRPLKQVLDRHAPIDFVLRSHSSANSRVCYEIVDRPSMIVDDLSAYTRDFAAFARATGTRHAIPFASNHCYLHDETYRFNDLVVTPLDVAEHCARDPEAPSVTIMLSGDRWSKDRGYELEPSDHFTNRAEHLRSYRDSQVAKLDEAAMSERAARFDRAQVDQYFSRLFAALPWFLRMLFRDRPVTWVLIAGEQRTIVETDLFHRTVRVLNRISDGRDAIEVHVSLRVMQHCMTADLFSLMPISKRVRYRVTVKNVRYVEILKKIFNLYERGYLPLRGTLSVRFFREWGRRWRELLLYAEILVKRARGKTFRFTDYLPVPAGGPKASGRTDSHPGADPPS